MNENYLDNIPMQVIGFINYQSNVKNKSELTLNEYCLDLRLFLKFVYCKKNNLKPDFDNTDISFLDNDFFSDITLADAYSFLAYCKSERDNNEKTRSRNISSIRSFFKYLQINKLISW